MIEAAVIDGEICQNIDFTVELALLTCEPEEALAKLRQMAEALGAHHGASIRERLAGPLCLPSGRQEKLRRALALVKALGRAVGEKLAEEGYGGEHGTHCQAFLQGMFFKKKPEDAVCSARERLFFECGHISADIVGGAVFGGKKAPRREAADALRKSMEAFREGVETCTD